MRFVRPDELRGAVTTLGGAVILAVVGLGVSPLQARRDRTRYLDAPHSPNDTLGSIDRGQNDQVVAACVSTARLAAQVEGGSGRFARPFERPASTRPGSWGSR